MLVYIEVIYKSACVERYQGVHLVNAIQPLYKNDFWCPVLLLITPSSVMPKYDWADCEELWGQGGLYFSPPVYNSLVSAPTKDGQMWVVFLLSCPSGKNYICALSFIWNRILANKESCMLHFALGLWNRIRKVGYLMTASNGENWAQSSETCSNSARKVVPGFSSWRHLRSSLWQVCFPHSLTWDQLPSLFETSSMAHPSQSRWTQVSAPMLGVTYG